MAAKDVLGLVIRIAALYLMSLGLYELFYAIIETFGLVVPGKYPPSHHCFFGLVYFIVGLVVLKCADRIASFSYGQKNTPKE
jgi:hypothetical protein